MRKYLIATHGTLAEGFRSALEIITGCGNQVHAVCAFVDDEPLEQKLTRALCQFSTEDELVIFTDLNGGSVNRFFVEKLAKGSKFSLFTNVSLAHIIELVTSLSEPLEEIEISEALERLASQPIYMNPVVQAFIASSNEEDDYDD